MPCCASVPAPQRGACQAVGKLVLLRMWMASRHSTDVVPDSALVVVPQPSGRGGVCTCRGFYFEENMKSLSAMSAILVLFLATASFAASGADLYKTKCAACHGASGEGKASMKTPDMSQPASRVRPTLS
jgi:cytochrome c553